MLITWIITGAVLILAELIVPGLVLVFLGAGAFVVALLVWLGVIESWVTAFLTWFISSLFMLLVLRSLFQRLMPGEARRQSADEDLDAYGEEVDVVETITPEKEGRISYRGTTWKAACYEKTIEAGGKARIVYRENLIWVVEPVAASGSEEKE
jgi:membrane protein implicated in regulation of membrane protease activity